MTESRVVDSLEDALRRGRIAAEMTIADAVRDGQSWKEETVTDNLLRAVVPFVKYTTFTRKEEANTGADWMWWWVDDSGEAFGMLIQAKRPHGPKGKEKYDVGAKGGEQFRSLLATAAEFGLAPAYSLYAEPDLRERNGDPRSVSLVPALVAEWATPPDYSAAEWRERGLPLEALAAPAPKIRPLTPVLEAIVDPTLLTFLQQPQAGARNVAKHLLAQITAARARQFNPATAERSRLDSPLLVFSDFPKDHGHGGGAYFPHVLRGLRREPPAYVLDILADQLVDAVFAEPLAGIAVFKF